MSDYRDAGRDLPLSLGGGNTLHPEIYQKVRRLAALHLAREAGANTLQPTALAHEAWLRIGGHKDYAWRDRGHFYAAASATMRRILIDQARRKSCQRRGGGRLRVILDVAEDVAAPMRDAQLILMDEGLSELEKSHPVRAQVVVEKFFGGLTSEEVAESLGIGVRSVERHWAMAKIWLLRWMERGSSA